MCVWKQGDHTVIDVKLTDIKGNELKVFMVFKKFPDVVLVFVGQDSAGRIDKRAADFKIICCVFQNIVLNFWQSSAFLNVLVSNFVREIKSSSPTKVTGLNIYRSPIRWANLLWRHSLMHIRLTIAKICSQHFHK